jgi:hypothetical protein
MKPWNCKELDDAFNKCERTHIGTGACRVPQYLMARYKYHRLLVREGILDPALAEPLPRGMGRPSP